MDRGILSSGIPCGMTLGISTMERPAMRLAFQMECCYAAQVPLKIPGGRAILVR